MTRVIVTLMRNLAMHPARPDQWWIRNNLPLERDLCSVAGEWVHHRVRCREVVVQKTQRVCWGRASLNCGVLNIKLLFLPLFFSMFFPPVWIFKASKIDILIERITFWIFACPRAAVVFAGTCRYIDDGFSLLNRLQVAKGTTCLHLSSPSWASFAATWVSCFQTRNNLKHSHIPCIKWLVTMDMYNILYFL